jgi:hypothetical protein
VQREKLAKKPSIYNLAMQICFPRSAAFPKRTIRRLFMPRKKGSERKYDEAASESVASALHREKLGMLRSGKGGIVTSRKQAIAIGLSEARKEGDEVPPKSS